MIPVKHPVVREATPADAKALIQLRKSIYRETPNLLYEPWEYNNTPRDEKRYIERFISPANSLLLVAEAEQQLLGLLGAMGGSLSKNAHAAQLFLAVRQSHWGRGIATELISHTIEWAPTAGLKRLALTVAVDNTRAHALYKAHGFVDEGIQRSAIREGEHSFRDEISMALLL